MVGFLEVLPTIRSSQKKPHSAPYADFVVNKEEKQREKKRKHEKIMPWPCSVSVLVDHSRHVTVHCGKKVFEPKKRLWQWAAFHLQHPSHFPCFGICMVTQSLSNCSVQLETAFLLSCAFTPLSQQASQLLLLGCCFIHVSPSVCKVCAADVAIGKNEGFLIHQNSFQHERRCSSGFFSLLPFFPRHRRLEELEYKFYIQMRIDCLAIHENIQGEQARLWVHICVNHSRKAFGESKCQIWDPLKSY